MFDPKKMYEQREPPVLRAAPRPPEQRPRVTRPDLLLGWSHAREANLAVLGFTTYKKYVASALWKSIRVRVRERSGGRCEFGTCQLQSYCVHHVDYSLSTLRGDSLEALVDVCQDHHREAHWRPRKRTRIAQYRITRESKNAAKRWRRLPNAMSTQATPRLRK